MALSDNNDSLPWMNEQSDWKNSANFSQKLESQYLNDDFSQDPAFAYSKVRNHNNSAIDGFYQELIKQSNNLTIITFRNDLMQHEARSRAAAKRRPEPPIVVNQILPGEEQRFLSNFLKQPFVDKTGIENMPYAQNANAYVYQGTIPSESLSNAIPSSTTHEMPNDKRYRKKKNKKSSKNNSINVNDSNGIGNNYESVQQGESNTDTQESESRQMLNTSNPVVYLEIAIDGEPRGTMIIELFRNVVPRTAENFRALCTGEHNFGYRYSYFHRIIPGFMCQAGDFEKSDGTGGYSIYGGEFADENFILKHDKPFLLSMANCGPGTNGSQFFITVTPCPHLDGKHVVFGQVLQGFHVVKDIEMCGTDSGEITREVKITKCGQIR